VPRDLPLSGAAHAGRVTTNRMNLFLPPANSAPDSRPSTKQRVNLLRMPETATRGGRAAGGVRLPYVPGLDGLRALAVVAVLLYHAGLAWIPGGFLGVEVFFVVSGYLITALLLAEARERGRVDLRAFWIRRARRLLPALYLLLIATLAFAVVFLPGEVAGLRNDAVAAFGYATNWYLLAGQESYFEAIGRPSPLLHLWSLAVEEQFYVLWPPLFALGMGVGALRYRRRRLVSLLLAGAAASAALMAILYHPNLDPSRLHYGTDTRATGLLVGAALAFAWTPPAPGGPLARRRGSSRRARRLRHRWGWAVPVLLDAAGVAALAGLVLSCLWLDEYRPFLYRGGYALVALATAAVICALAHPRTRLAAGPLGWRPVRWVGVRSYGIYLWHWPVFVVTRPQLDVPLDGLPLLALRLTATVLLAALSYRYVEEPIRRGALGRAWKRLREARGPLRWRLGVRWAGAVVPAAALCVVLGVAVGQAEAPAPPSYLSSMKTIHTAAAVAEDAAPRPEAPETQAPATPPAPREEDAPATEAPAPKAEEEAPREETPPEAAPAAAAAEPAPAGRVSAIGDSVMLGAAATLTRAVPALDVMDAEVGTQVSYAIEILRWRRDAGQLGDVVVVHLGNNGAFAAGQFDEMMEVLGDERRVVFVNVRVPRAWEGPNNAVIAEGVARHPNAVLADWYSASAYHPEFFVEDGVHLQTEGQRVYADLIAAQLNQ
jgi:peptidoglycan/LPS O-acetylase OafA/YrhL